VQVSGAGGWPSFTVNGFFQRMPSGRPLSQTSAISRTSPRSWPNRLIGDQQLPPEKRFTHTNLTKFTATSPLMPSGLLGPIILR
jgi:hypothetical protein